MFTELSFKYLPSIIAIITLFLLYQTIKSNRDLNQKILFSNITKEERELKIKLQEYREKEKNKKTKKQKEEVRLDYETLLFNYYEYLAICLYKNLIKEDETKLYFRDLLKGVKEYFEASSLFEKGLAKRKEYPGI